MEETRYAQGDSEMTDWEDLPPKGFKGLPVELRTKIIRGDVNHHSRRQDLRLISKDLNEIVAPIHFETILADLNGGILEYKDPSTMQETLARYGEFVKGLGLTNHLGTPITPSQRAAAASILQLLPEIERMYLWGQCFEVVASVAHLGSLTTLEVYSQQSELYLHLVPIVTRSPHLVSFKAILPMSFPSIPFRVRPDLIAALASLRFLTTLELDCADLFDEDLATADWEAPLATLKISSTFHNAISLSTLGTFVAHFSNTLQSLTLDGTLDHSSITLSDLPFHLPRLEKLDLEVREQDDGDPWEHLAGVFTNSPLKAVRLEEIEGDMDPGPSGIGTFARTLVHAHAGTLKSLTVAPPSYSREDRSTSRRLRSLPAYGAGMGITVRVESEGRRQGLFRLAFGDRMEW